MSSQTTNGDNLNSQHMSSSSNGKSNLIIEKIRRYFSPMFQKKQHFKSKSELKKCLTTLDLTSLGVGAVLGAGVYVVAGQVASLVAGPSVVISFVISAFASLLSGLAYAEFGSRVPNTTGGAYAYSYVTVGEIWAFFIGWNLILEYMIGTAADASALSASFEHLFDPIFGNTTHYYFSPFDPIIGDARPDMVAFFLTIGITWLLAFGCKDSARFGTFCNFINVTAIAFVVIVGSYYADPSKWSSYEKFFPYGVSGTLSGAAACFYAFVGFDIIATTGEESANPSQSIPRAIVYTLTFVIICYVSVSTVITMLTDYKNLGERAPLVVAFQMAGVSWAGHVISIGAVFGVASSLLGSMFPLPRIIYAMACDSLFHPIFSRVNKFSNVPVLATVIPGFITAVFALIFDLKELVEMMSIGTLLAYSLVSLCVIVLRYQPNIDYCSKSSLSFNDGNIITSVNNSCDINKYDHIDSSISHSSNNFLSKIHNYIRSFKVKNSVATEKSFKCAILSCFICICSSTLCSLAVILGFNDDGQFSPLSNIIVIIFGGLFITCYTILQLQPQNDTIVAFKAPCVPALPITAIVINVFLMMKLSKITWIRFGVWMILGIIIYFGYSIRNSDRVNSTPTTSQDL